MRDGVPANGACTTLKPNNLAVKAIIARQDDAATVQKREEIAEQFTRTLPVLAPGSMPAACRGIGPLRGEGLVRVVRLMLAHGRVVVTMRHGRPHTRNHTRRSVPSERDQWCSEPVNDPLTTRRHLAAVIEGRCPSW
jgi:hypothetical protein